MSQSPFRPTPREQAAIIVSRLRSATLAFPIALLSFELGSKLKALEIEIAEMSDEIKEPLADAGIAIESICRVFDMSPRPEGVLELHRKQALEALAELQVRLLSKEVL